MIIIYYHFALTQIIKKMIKNDKVLLKTVTFVFFKKHFYHRPGVSSYRVTG